MPTEKKALFYYETFVGGTDFTTSASIERNVAELIGRRGTILTATVTGSGTVDIRINDNADFIRLTGNAPEYTAAFDTTKIDDVEVRSQAQIAFFRLVLVTGTPTVRVFIY